MNSTEIIDAVAGMPQHRVGADNNEFDMDQDNFMEDLLYSGLMLGQDLTTDAPPADASQQEEPLTGEFELCICVYVYVCMCVYVCLCVCGCECGCVYMWMWMWM